MRSATETVIVHPASRGTDDDGHLIPGGADRVIMARSVQQLSAADMSETDKNGNIRVLRIWCAAGELPADGDDVTIRGLIYQVRVPGWDPGACRRPALSRHRPQAVFDAARGEG